MGLLQKACETYDNHKNLVGVIKEGGAPLVPVSHILQNANLEITIDNMGNFVNASVIAKENANTIVPVTIASGGRSGKDPAPHPLCDKLQYFLKSSGKKYKAYIEQLRNWEKSKYKDPKISAVLKYVESGTILNDLADYKIITNIKPTDKEAGLFVRWRVEGLGSDDKSACWEDKKMFRSWTDYYLSTFDKNEDLCMITGVADFITENHPKNIVAINANAKLLSANDSINFTFRGRFTEGREASSIGYLASQKAHNALRWEASKGKIIGGRTFMCWNPKGKEIPRAWEPLNLKNEELITPTDYSRQLKDTLEGYRKGLFPTDDVIVVSMDAATTGRLALTYYNELKASDFLDRIESWYNSCYWHKWQNKKLIIHSPSVYQIVRAAYGIERAATGKLDFDDVLSREHYQRLFKCIIDKTPLPYDIVRALFCKASKPESYDRQKYYNYKEVLDVSCAVIRKFLNDRCKKEEWTLELDKDKKERSYLFGRLLAIMEKIELDTHDSSETRESNAIRMQSAFCERPFFYMKIIHSSLDPYFARLRANGRFETYNMYKKMIGEIMKELDDYNKFELNRPLTETYLLGYYLQRNDLYKSKKE